MNPTFDNTLLRALPADPETKNFRRQVFGAIFSKTEPTQVQNPKLIGFSREVAEELGLRELTDEWVEALAGNTTLSGMEPYSTCYGGHQFGNWAGQLGDGRAISLGHLVGADKRRFELQLKGAGPTPYSRTADGRAVMRSSVREFLCSEAMHHLGVPTTRALSLIGTGDDVVRDVLYDGNPHPEPGAVVCRVAPSFIRFGHFQLPAARGDDELLKTLAEYVIRTHFSELVKPEEPIGPDVVLAFLKEVCARTATMIAHWMRVGFVHGVMNTDNMSVLGLTIDYGPYGWLDNFDPNWTPNTTDAAHRRYRFGKQPEIALWNLVRFAESLFPLVNDVEELQEALKTYETTLDRVQRGMLADKLGLSELRDDDPQLIQDLFGLMASVETDMTIFFRALPRLFESGETMPVLRSAFYEPSEVEAAPWEKWVARYRERVASEPFAIEERTAKMNAANPKYVLRNYLAQLAIDEAEKGDGGQVMELLEVMRHPYDEQPEFETYAGLRPDWARTRVGCSMLSCSS